ncbi:MAG TPA: secretin N-terminal domain-containing protein [Pyrinomonadaceae bacterium]|nr:secretin N-terminal domain-containing protein [Pyrinomonadaceae bacterium]
MLTNRIRITAAAFALALFASAAATVPAQQPAQQQQPRPTPTPAPFVDHKSFQSMVFNVRHRDPETLVPVLRLLTSGHNGAAVSADRNFRVITVRDFPENVASIEEAIKRLDTPEGERPGIDLRIHVLLASESAAAAGAEQPPAELRDVLAQLRSTLNFKSYELLTSVVQRTSESRGRSSGYLQGNGTVEATGPGGEKQTFNYTFSADSLSLMLATNGAATVQLGNFVFEIQGRTAGVVNAQARIRSDVSLREGERVVVGTAGMGNRALILILTARGVK